MSDAPLASAVGANDILQVLQSGGIVLATAGQLWAIPMAKCASLGDAVTALTARVAVLEGKTSPNVVLTGTIPVGTVQVGSVDLAVPVQGLLRTDTVVMEIEVDVPAGLDLRAAHPDRTRDGYLIVQAATTGFAAVPIVTAIPIRVVAER